MNKFLVVLFALLSIINGETLKSDKKNGTQMLEIHVIPHTHDDVGWLKTVDEYFYGYKNDIQLAGVQYTIEGVVTELLLDPKKTFVYVEMAFFYRWYKNQNQEKKDQVKGLVNSGQLEFITGGVCMNDEANPYYEDMIDQMTWGHQLISREFNVAPTIGWQIDPFGHSATQARLFYDMGFDGWFFARIDHQDDDKRLRENNLEMIMNPVSSAQQNKPIFTGVLYDYYCSPGGFCFDVFDRNDPIMYDKSLEYYNLDRKADDFINYFRQQSTHYKQNIVMKTFGCDFQYMDAKMNFMNLDRLIDYLNLPENVEKYQATVQYSTMSRYLERVNQQNITSYQTKTDDFFPYASDTHDYWTGYYTSRVNSKYLIRETGRFLQNARTLLTNLTLIQALSPQQVDTAQTLLFDLEHFQGITQHHDAVAGTEREAVNQDYSRMLTRARDNLQAFLKTIFSQEIHKQLDLDIQNLQFCRWNQTSNECGVVGQEQNVLLAVHNPLHFQQPAVVLQVKVDGPNYSASPLSPSPVPQAFKSQTICSNSIDDQDCVLYIQTVMVPASFSFFQITYQADLVQTVVTRQLTSDYRMEDPLFSLNISDYQHFNYQSKVDDSSHFQFQLEYLFYKSYQGDGHKSGAYSFRPSESDAKGEHYSRFNRGRVLVGSFVTVVELFRVDTFNNNDIRTQLKFYTNVEVDTRFGWGNMVEVESHVNSINIEDGQGKEVVLRLTNPHIHNEGVFYTDSNGLEMQQRIRNYRATWQWERDELVAGNYYPVNALIGIQDTNQALYLLNDRSQGGSSLQDGQLEVMIHRRLLFDDDKGVCEPLNEKGLDGKGMKTKTRHFITTSYSHATKLQFLMDQQPLATLSPLPSLATPLHYQPPPPHKSFIQSHDQNIAYSKLYLFFDLSNTQQIFFRLQNLDSDQSSINYDLTGFQIQELSLTANMLKSTMEERRLKWNYNQTYPESQQILQDNIITLKHLEIKTYSLQINQANLTA